MATSTLKPPKEASAAVKDDKKKSAKGGKEAKSSGSKKKLIIIAVVVLLAVGGGVKFFVLGGSTAPAKPQPGAVLKLDSINVNLADGHYLKLGLALQTTTKASADIDGSQALDIAIAQLSGRKMDELAVPAKREKAKTALVAAISKAYDGEVMDVYLTEFVMQ
ncbi:MAG TPA: flagellar basal body-associated FliL family protein [Actinomycetales bacterium]|nr:flagellar basal body-associated FliL family protein [Actinomycetales bacterium]